LLHALTDENIFVKILEQGADELENNEYLKENYPGQDKEYIVDYFMRIKDR
jgi:hypothetical protein